MAARSAATLDLPGGLGTTGARKKAGLMAWFAQERVFRLIPFLLVEGTFLLLLAIPFVLTIYISLLSWRANARPQAQLEAGARYERTL